MMSILDITSNSNVRHRPCLHSAIFSTLPISPTYIPEISLDIIQAIVVYANEVLKKNLKQQSRTYKLKQPNPFEILVGIRLLTGYMALNHSKERER